MLTVQAELMRETLARVGRARTRVRGHSMAPWIRSGDWLEVVEVPPREAKVGDVLVFELDGALVAHRARARTRDGWITRGDSCEDAERIPDEAIVGRVEGTHLRWLVLRRLPRAAHHGIGRVLLHVSPWLWRGRAALRRAR